MNNIQQRIEAFCNFIVEKPKQTISIAILFSFCFLIGIPQLKSNFSIKIWLEKDDHRIIQLEEHEKTFGNSDTIDVIIYNKDGIFNNETLNSIRKVTDEMWSISDIVRVESLSNFNKISSNDDDISITPFLEKNLNLSSEQLNELKIEVKNDENIYNNYVSQSFNIAYIRAFLKVTDKKPRYQKIIHEVEDLLKKHESPNYKIQISGIAYINESLNRASNRDMLLIFPIICILIFLILFLYFKSYTAILLPFLVIIFSIISTTGLEGLIGIEFNNILAIVPAVLIAIGLADAIHVLISYRHFNVYENYSNKDAAILSLKKNFIPTILTSFTTCIGFYSFLSTNITPIFNLGLLAGTGCLFAWFYTYFLLGPLLKNIKFKKTKSTNLNLQKITAILREMYKYKTLIVSASIVITIVMFSIGIQNTINSDTIEYFSKNTDIRQTFDLMDKEFGGSRAIELVFDSEEVEGIKNPEFLKNSDDLINWMESNEEIIRVSSIIPILKKMNKTLHGDDQSYYKLAKSRPEISDQLFLYTFGLPSNMDLKNQISLDNQKLRVIVIWNIKDTLNSIIMTKKIIEKAKEYGVKVVEAGQSPIYNHLNDLIVNTFYKSMGLTLPVIFLIILLTFRNLKIALLSLIPNLFPLIISGGIMYLKGDEINIGNIIVFAVCMGIAVDDTIHFISNFQLRKNQGLNNLDALAQTLAQTGKALILTTILLVIGFGMFVIGDFIPNQKFGIYCSLILCLALVADLVLLPVLLMNEKSNK